MVWPTLPASAVFQTPSAPAGDNWRTSACAQVILQVNALSLRSILCNAALLQWSWVSGINQHVPPAQVYLIIKDVCPGEDEVIIITSSLMKDMNSKTDLYRSNAIRVLCSICGQDTQLLVQIERYLKQAIVDKVRGSTMHARSVSQH